MYTRASFADACTRLAAFVPKAGKEYARLRNYDEGPDKHQAVSGLSPYLARRVILPEEVIAAVAKVHPQQDAAQFYQEVYWQTYWRGWLAMRPQVWEDAQNFSKPTGQLYYRAIDGKTGIDAFDFWVCELRTQGYLHNHARMWFASIWIHTLKLPWKWGAQFFFDHLCDADCASNTLNWRWVAGLQTKGKAYLATSQNIIRYTRNRFKTTHLLVRPSIPMDTADTALMRTLPQFPTHLTTVDGWILFPDDYSIHRTASLYRLPVLALHPSMAYSWPSRVVQQFNEDLLQDLRTQIPNLTVASTLQTVTDWIKTHRVSRLGVVKPSVGIYDALLRNVQSYLPSGVRIMIMQRAWDQTYFPSATKGYFHFKKSFE